MARPVRPLFLERTSYRRRRAADAARLLPVLGLMLFAVPLLWPQEGEAAVRGSRAIVYVFGVWVVLIFCAWSLSRLVSRSRREDGRDAALHEEEAP
ncbi:hypothetical protein E0K89_015170 [Aquicoccus sp. SCR17]|nr:hypothetical protein [Carideicomes alvinocaridis]